MLKQAEKRSVLLSATFSPSLRRRSNSGRWGGSGTSERCCSNNGGWPCPGRGGGLRLAILLEARCWATCRPIALD